MKKVEVKLFFYIFFISRASSAAKKKLSEEILVSERWRMESESQKKAESREQRESAL